MGHNCYEQSELTAWWEKTKTMIDVRNEYMDGMELRKINLQDAYAQ